MERMDAAADMVSDLFAYYFNKTQETPEIWSQNSSGNLKTIDEPRRARLIADYIAGMTDLFAIQEHNRLL